MRFKNNMIQKNKTRKIAPKLENGQHRIPRYSALHPKVNSYIERMAIKFNCSKSFVIATMLAEFLHINNEGKYYE